MLGGLNFSSFDRVRLIASQRLILFLWVVKLFISISWLTSVLPLLDGPFLFEWEPQEEVSGTRLESPGLRALIYTWLRSDAFGRLNGRRSASILSPSLTSSALHMLAGYLWSSSSRSLGNLSTCATPVASLATVFMVFS